jgi:AraC-like DNA-binding protein
MDNRTHQKTKLWLMPEFDDLEVFRAKAIHYSYARHAHPSYSIGVIEAGVGGNSYRGSTYLAPPESVVFMNPEEAHTGYSAEEQPLTYRMLYPSVALVQQIADEVQIKGLPYFKEAVVQNKTLVRNLMALHVILERSPDPLEQQSRFVEVLSAILLHYAEGRMRATGAPSEHRAIAQVKTYLHENFSSTISLDQLVEQTNLNRSYLIRLFRQAVGMPPYTYLNQIRVEQAKQYLRQGMSVAETAIAVGMSDQSHLTRHFKRIVGVTPGHYRTMSKS